MRLSTLIAAVASLASGCQAQSQRVEQRTSPHRVPEITSQTEEDFHDLVFGLTAVNRAADGSQEITAVGTHQGRPVRFQAVLAPAWRRGEIAGRASFRGVVTVRSLGAESDTLVRIMDDLYRANVAPKGMAASVRLTAMSLEGDPSDLAGGEVKLKLFFESEDEDRYAELFLNIDQPKAKVELAEKDADYRGPVIRALSLGPE